jgi:uncharacterized protein YndB with AHSA1/START domain
MSAETTLADGIVTEGEGGAHVIHFERRLDHPIERVWASLTEPDHLINWWGEAEVELAEGGGFALRWLNTDEQGNAVKLKATVVELEAPRVLEIAGEWFTLTPEGERLEDTQTTLRWELEPDRDATVLRFWNTLELSEEERHMVPAGWHFHLDALATALDGGTTDLADPAGWEPIHEAYRTRAASTN